MGRLLAGLAPELSLLVSERKEASSERAAQQRGRDDSRGAAEGTRAGTTPVAPHPPTPRKLLMEQPEASAPHPMPPAAGLGSPSRPQQPRAVSSAPPDEASNPPLRDTYPGP